MSWQTEAQGLQGPLPKRGCPASSRQGEAGAAWDSQQPGQRRGPGLRRTTSPVRVPLEAARPGPGLPRQWAAARVQPPGKGAPAARRVPLGPCSTWCPRTSCTRQAREGEEGELRSLLPASRRRGRGAGRARARQPWTLHKACLHSHGLVFLLPLGLRRAVLMRRLPFIRAADSCTRQRNTLQGIRSGNTGSNSAAMAPEGQPAQEGFRAEGGGAAENPRRLGGARTVGGSVRRARWNPLAPGTRERYGQRPAFSLRMMLLFPTAGAPTRHSAGGHACRRPRGRASQPRRALHNLNSAASSGCSAFQQAPVGGVRLLLESSHEVLNYYVKADP